MHVLYFSSKTCGPCKQYLPIVQQTCKDLDVQLEVIDIHEDKGMAMMCSVTSLPTVAILRKSAVIQTYTGTDTAVGTKNKIARWADL